VIDNFGDVGVCWRLARQLVAEYGCAVHVWVNDAGWAAARQLIGGLPQTPAPTLAEGVTVSAWSLACASGDEDCTGDVLIEGFGCTLPQAALAQLAVRAQLGVRAHKPIWIDLEYFSAEDWVPRFHLQSGFDWEVGARRWFFFPGVHEHSGGMLRERGLVAADMGRGEAFENATDLAPSHSRMLRPNDGVRAVCFAYTHAPYAEWLAALASDRDKPIAIDLCGTQSQLAVAQLDLAAYPNVTTRNVPFVSQPEFDRLLWQTDVLFVRGEDSMARALWSGRPFIWHIYPQAENAHHPKLMAWLKHYTHGFPDALREALVEVHCAWNGMSEAASLGEAWTKLMAEWEAWQAWSLLRSNQLAQTPHLAERLMTFVRQRSSNSKM
jgi:uncharacterized repeat protein (TIGR03837 family)